MDSEFFPKEIIAVPYSAPEAPRNLQLSSINSQINLTWDASSNNNGRAINNYTIYRDGVAINTTSDNSILSYLDLDTITGTIYNYSVTASNGAESSHSNYVQSFANGPPSAPLNLQVMVGDNFTHLSWEAPASDGSSPITGYKIYRNGTTDIYTTDGNTFSYNDTTTENGKTYTYNISAININGEGVKSNPIYASPFGAPQLLKTCKGFQGIIM